MCEKADNTREMMSHDDGDSINFDKLERELMSAVEADTRYWRENDAKIRAVQNKVASYEEFKDIVLAAHLKPLDKGDKVSVGFNQPWNTTADRSKSHGQCISDSPATDQMKQDRNRIPKNGQEFARDWRRYFKTDTERCAYLLYIGAERLGSIFKAEISFGLLGDFLQALLQVPDDRITDVVKILDRLTCTNRFALSVQFLSSKEKECCAKLFQRLCERTADTPDLKSENGLERIRELMQVYEVTEKS